jgi:hypothetical protein
MLTSPATMTGPSAALNDLLGENKRAVAFEGDMATYLARARRQQPLMPM